MSVRFAVEALKVLRLDDYRLLVAVERGMINHEYVDVELVASISGLDADYAAERLKRLNGLGLVQRYRGPFTGYILTTRGYDALALYVLVKRGTLSELSTSPQGEGKESEVYLGKTPGGRVVAVKFHRAGRTSFRKTKRVRGYAADKRHVSWLYQARLAAKSEFEALRILWKGGVSVPEPVDWNRHVVVAGYVEGVELYTLPELGDPEGFLAAAVGEVGKAYEAGVVHGDLSEYNVLVAEGEKPVLIDWPQWVPSSHPSAGFYLRRDLERLASFFSRKYGVPAERAKRLVESVLAKHGAPAP
ncbi:RIO1 family regulatory kinase/ATPase domain-containing protein [Thermofilum pendens]|uniref:non-specific serine/threonine protein kinase n=1 Tax=Thermofilum pendens (strain DSM 2475 / Hrk 5) TaxID=368408 RepID=A1RY61_THEPD|nr:RIO1 family regulatory kinase/ATPase [Thermofilum pendens]ABL78141.1 protein of unknown function RIO1 [Thermofilum pendens Hrk 5]